MTCFGASLMQDPFPSVSCRRYVTIQALVLESFELSKGLALAPGTKFFRIFVLQESKTDFVLATHTKTLHGGVVTR